MTEREFGRNIEPKDNIFMGKMPKTPMCKQTLNRVADLLNWDFANRKIILLFEVR
jgi:hypothetical protein